MFAIATETRQYQTIILSDSANQTRLEVVPERGGIVTRWQLNGHEILYLDEARFQDPTLSVRGGIPILFPICGNLPDNTYTHNDQTYPLKQHGFARELPWIVLDQHADDASARVSLGLSSNEQTLAVYPFEFHLVFTYILQSNTLTLHQRYTNQSSTPMPFSAGFHPYFAVQDKAQLRVQIPSSQYDDNVTKSVQAFSGQFDFELDEIDAAFTELSSRVSNVVDEGRSQRLTLTFSPEFSTLVFWTVKGKPFYCLEPWTAPRNALNTGNHLLHLDPNQSLQLETQLTITQIA
ncbi:MAG: aldose epimerase [Oscillatoriales cyanobacterium C42_A2020_001]|nr:aldose epimerase [Leptolyngbyaceae cyanobacterium C42_A2020_001]